MILRIAIRMMPALRNQSATLPPSSSSCFRAALCLIFLQINLGAQRASEPLSSMKLEREENVAGNECSGSEECEQKVHPAIYESAGGERTEP
jgi:hypothetical protein